MSIRRLRSDELHFTGSQFKVNRDFLGSADGVTLYNTDMDAAITRNPKIMHGAPCFAGTRVTVRSLFDHLAAGYTVEGFLEQFPTVTRDQVMSLLDSLDDAIEHTAVMETT